MPRGALRCAALLAAAGALVAVLPACAPASGLAAPDGLRVVVMQQRSDVAPRQAEVRVINGSDVTVTVAGVTVTDPRFDGAATRVVADRTTALPAGGTVDVRVQLPAVACGAGIADDEGTTEVRIDAAIGRDTGVLTLEATDPLGFIAPLHERECRAEALAAAVGLSFTDFLPSAAGEPATLRLAVVPAGGAATIVDVQPTVLLAFDGVAPGAAFPLDLEITPDSAATVVDLPIIPSRCDPHVVQEDKRGAVFELDVAVDGEPGTIELFAGEDLRGRILTWVAEWCGFGGG